VTNLVESILKSMSSVNKPQRLFITNLFATLMVFQGKANFRNLSRYSHYCERTFSRWYHRGFSFLTFNTRLMNYYFTDNEQIAAIDASFISKSGKKTQGLASFFNGARSIAEKGLEISLICLVDLKSNTAYSLDARQTIDTEHKTRIDLYCDHISDIATSLKKLNVVYLAADAFYSKFKFVNKVTDCGLHIIGKLRIDANFSWIYKGEYSGKGRPKKFEGKVDIHKQLNLFMDEIELENGLKLYSSVVYSHSLKREIKVVVVEFNRRNEVGRIILFSTDLMIRAQDVLKYYKSRFQIEFIFRDAKQYTGLTQCQSRKSKVIENHVNAALTTLNLLKIEDANEKDTQEKSVISIASWKRRKFNQHLIGIVIDRLGFSMTRKKVIDMHAELSDYGVIGF